MSVICMERYIAVVYPMYFQLLKTYRFREVSAVVVRCLTLSLSSIYIANLKNNEHLNERIFDFPAFLLLGIGIITVHCSIRMAYLLKQLGPGREKYILAKRKLLELSVPTYLLF